VNFLINGGVKKGAGWERPPSFLGTLSVRWVSKKLPKRRWISSRVGGEKDKGQDEFARLYDIKGLTPRTRGSGEEGVPSRTAEKVGREVDASWTSTPDLRRATRAIGVA